MPEQAMKRKKLGSVIYVINQLPEKDRGDASSNEKVKDH